MVKSSLPIAAAARALALGALLAPTTVLGEGDLLQHGASTNGNNCLQVNSATSAIVSAYCTGGDEQLFAMTDRRFLRIGSDSNPLCLKYLDDNSVKAAVCDVGSWNQQWRVEYDGTIATVGTNKFGMCLDASSSINGVAKLSECRASQPSQLLRSSSLAVDTGDVLTANGLCLDYAGASSAVPSQCHGGFNQVWSYTFDQELRTLDGNCLEFDQTSLKKVSVAKCRKADKQKWSLGVSTGNVSPLSTSSLCLDLGMYPVELSSCGSPKLTATQSFSVNGVIAARSRNLKRTMIEVPLVYVGPNCVTVNRANQDAHISPCSRNVADMWWEINSASSKTIKLAGELCLDLSLTDIGRVTYTKCTGQANQQWSWNTVSGAITSVVQSSKCLAFSTTGGTGFEAIKLLAQDCTPSAPHDNQVFRQRDFSDIAPPSRASVQQTYCSQRGQHPGDVQFLRDTLLWSAKDMRGLVPTTLAGREDYNYYTSVVLESISTVINESARALSENEIVAKVTAVASGPQALLELGEMMCAVRERSAELRPKLTALFVTFSADSKRLASVVNYLRLANVQFQFAALPSDSALLSVASSSIAKSMDSVLQTYMAASDFVGLSSFALSSDFSWFAQVVTPLCTAKPSLAICAVTSFSELVIARSDLRDAVQVATVTSLRTNEFVTSDVLNKADTFMQKYRKGLAASTSSASALGWNSLVQSTLFGSANPVYNSSDMLRTTDNSDLMMVFALWPYFSEQEMSNNSTWSPLFASLDNQLYTARRATIQTLVYSSRVQSLEAYFGGLSSDMATLATQVLPRICARFSKFKSCGLIQFHSLVTARADLNLRMRYLGTLTDEVSTLAGAFVKVFADGTSLVANDELWTMAAVRLLFNSVELQVFPSSSLLTTATPNASLIVYAVFAHYSNGMTPLLPYFTFLSDQVAVAHFNTINKLVNDRNVDGMAVYVDPMSNATVSDLGVFGAVVLPQLCNNPNNPDFSVCKLQDFYTGLMQAISFEQSRGARTISLVDIVEVDVRKQLDVIDQESKQMEIISTIQDSANLVGQKIQEESDKIQVVVQAEASSIRASIATNTKLLSKQLGDVGREIQRDIDASTRILEDTIGAAADVIRQDIAYSTQKLYSQMDDKSREIQRSIEENTKKLATQIGAEADATRNSIAQSTRQLSSQISSEAQATRSKIDESTNKLYTKIGQEGQAIRSKIDESTDKLYTKIGDEGQKTRNKIDDSTRELTQVINTNTAKLSDKIDESTSTVVSKFESGFSSLEGYFKADAAQESLLVRIRDSLMIIKQALDKLEQDSSQFGNTMEYIRVFTNGRDEVPRNLNDGAAIANLAALVMHDALRAHVSIYEEAAYLDYAPRVASYTNDMWTPSDMAEKGEKVRQQFYVFTDTLSKSMILQESLSKDFTDLRAILTDPSANPGTAETAWLTNTLLRIYGDFKSPLTPQSIELMLRELDRLVEAMEPLAKVNPRENLTFRVDEARKNIRNLLPQYLEAFSVVTAQYELIAQTARDVVNTKSGMNMANAAKGGSHRRRLRAQAASSFKPLYTMAYAGLSKLFMQYRIQQAALEFCNYYEYKLGGVAPPICGSTKFYTPTDIQNMRSYKASTVKSVSIFALLPTKPAPVSDSGLVAHPFLDLDRLLAGEKVTIALPTADLAWLKQYNWLYWGDSETTFNGIFIESMQLMLPFTPVPSNANPGVFNMAVTVNIGQTQRLNPVNEKTFVLPATDVRFSTAFNARVCPNKITNPYHDIAGCVKSDGSSTVCVYEDGQVPSTELLPSLFSRWEVTMASSGSVNATSDAYKLALPSLNETNAVDLNVLVMLKVVRVSNAKTTSTTTTTVKKASNLESIGVTAEPTCCATDTYLAGSSCVKCPDGSTGALNGYTCQRN